MASNTETSFSLGDMFWAKVGSHPWWPCMIYHTPDGSPFTRQSQKGIFYHVQFFGPLVERAWVYVTNLIPFLGKKKFDEYVSEKLSATKDKSERSKYDAKATSCNRDIWVQSWKEAESALTLPSDKRIEKFGRISVSKKMRTISSLEECEILKLLPNVPLTSEEETEALASYVRQEADSRTERNPDIDRNILEDELKAQWPSFDISTKRSYLQNKLGIFQIQSDRPKRKSKVDGEQPVANKNVEDSQGSTKKAAKKKCTETSVKVAEDSLEFDVEIHRLIVSPAQYRLQPVCPVCEIYSVAVGQMFKCQGPCGRLVHPSCMRYKTPPPSDNNRPEKFRCPECLTGNFLCGLCGNPADLTNNSLGDLHRCQVADCGRYFHKDCVIDWPGVSTTLTDKKLKSGGFVDFQLLRCPSHCCQTCCLEQGDLPGTSPTLDSPLLQCVRCPAAFHIGDLCTPAGSVEVSLSHIVCPRHFEDDLNRLPAFKTQHPNWCFECLNTMTEKISCKTCPAVYHKDCLVEPVNEDFKCHSCRYGMFPRYAQIVWAKIAHFRWWPCEIIHARNAPINILNMSHPEGTFPVHFLGSDEYQWVCRGSVLPYELGLKSSAAKDNRGSKSVERAFTRALVRAPKNHQLYVNHVLKRGLPLTSMHADPLPEEELLLSASTDVNVVVHHHSDEEHKTAAMLDVERIESIIYPADLWPLIQKAMEPRLSVEKCICSDESNSSQKMCTKEGHCVHVENRVECTQDICPFASKDCGNRRFAEMASVIEDKRVSIFRTINRGYGLKANMAFKKDAFVTEYAGEVITVEEANKRIVESLGPSALATMTSQRKGFKPQTESYLIRLCPDWDFVIDARTKGNFSRFINHSCEPNLRSESWIVEQKPRLVLLAARSIATNEELTLDYQAAELLATGLMGASCLCLCGTDSCVSTLKVPNSYVSISVNQEVASHSSGPSIGERRKSKQKTAVSPTHMQVNMKTTPIKTSTKEEPPFSVVSLLAASSSHTASRPDRSLVQPTASMRSNATKSGSAAVKPENKTARIGPPGLRPPPHEDFCYRCGDGGELLLCDKTTCSKSFHLNCLGLTSPPAGIWYCPWHYCDCCGHPSTHMCWRCPNSYCETHAEESRIQVDELDKERWEFAKSGLNAVTNITVVSSFRWICSDHVGMNIQGPGDRPHLSSSDKSARLSGPKNVKSVGFNKNSLEEIENVQPTAGRLKGTEMNSSFNDEFRCSSTSKSKVKKNGNLHPDPSQTVVSSKRPAIIRKRPATLSPLTDKKRPRLNKDISK